MDLKAKTIIAELPAVDPAIGPNGPVMGFNAANAIAEALEAAGFEVVQVERLDGPLRPAGSADLYRVPVADENAPEPVEEK